MGGVRRGSASSRRSAVLTVWTHACIGIHFWLRTKPWYADWRVYLAAVGLLLPTLALAGYVTAGNQVLREAGVIAGLCPGMRSRTPISPKRPSPRSGAWWRSDGPLHLGLVLLPFAGRGVRAWLVRRRRPPHADACGRPHGRDDARSDRAGDVARKRHPARVGLRRTRAVHHVPDSGDQGAGGAAARRRASRRTRSRASMRRPDCGSPARSARPPTSA